MNSNVTEPLLPDATPFALLWDEEMPSEPYDENAWFFSEDTQGFSNYTASTRDKLVV